MKLYIDTSDATKIVVGINKARFEAASKQDKSQRLLPFIQEVLKKENYTLKDIKSIEVNTGPGSFTGLRVGISVANALGWALGVKVNGNSVLTGKMNIHYS
jgi:tRNA threonylcarbamoyladenosine biosynthesis protein TsaB